MGLESDIAYIKEKLAQEELENSKDKKWKLPGKAKVKGQKAKQNWVGILKINENGFITPLKQPIEQQTVMVDGVPRLATPEYILRWKQGFSEFPVMILPSWSVKPFSPNESSLQSEDDGSNTKGYKILMARMKSDQVSEKKPMPGWIKYVGLALLAGVIIYAIISGGGG